MDFEFEDLFNTEPNLNHDLKTSASIPIEYSSEEDSLSHED